MVGLAESAERVPYSIASSPEEAAAANELEFLIKIEPSGRWGHKFDRIARGQRVALNGPFGSFVYPARPGQKHLLFIAGGTGIAPIRSMIAHAIDTGLAGRLKLLYSARTAEDFAYLSELRGMVRRGQIELRLHATREASAETLTCALRAWTHHTRTPETARQWRTDAGLYMRAGGDGGRCAGHAAAARRAARERQAREVELLTANAPSVA